MPLEDCVDALLKQIEGTDLMPTLYIHMGTPKTATTSIQMFFVENQERFPGKGDTAIRCWISCIPMWPTGGTDISSWEGCIIPTRQKMWPWKRNCGSGGLDMVHKEFEKYPNVIFIRREYLARLSRLQV